jgi:pre-mRNA-splicing factor ISY1
VTNCQIRDLNDEINRAMREKHVWEIQIRNLGGPNYMRGGGGEGAVPGGGNKGYRYFGRAKDLPGVRELFEAAAPKAKDDKPLDSKHEIRKQVDAAYYGWGDDEEDDGGKLLKYEEQKEEVALKALSAEGGEIPDGWEPLPGDWKVPNREEVQEELVERRRRRLLERLG